MRGSLQGQMTELIPLLLYFTWQIKCTHDILSSNRAFQSRKAAHKQKWRTVCADVSERHCDFTDAKLNYWGIYYLRVRANTAQWFSSWTNISFCPDKDGDELVCLFLALALDSAV